MTNRTLTVVVVDDSDEVRSLVKTRLRLSGHFDVVAEGSDGTEAIGLAYQHQPDVMLLDTSMPRMDGLEALVGILTIAPDTRVVIYSGFEERGLADRAREYGAIAFLEKSLPIEQLADELLEVLADDDAAAGLEKSASSQPTAPARPLSLVGSGSAGTAEGSEEQQILDEHLERFREVFDQAAIGMATMTLTGSIVRANRALGAMMLCAHEDLVGLHYGRLAAGRGEELDAALRDIVEKDLDLVHFEHEVEGWLEPRAVLATMAPVRDSKGHPLYVFLQLQDVTGERLAQDQLRQSEERFRMLVEAVDDYAIFMLSPEGFIVSWNNGAQRIKGYRADEIIGRHFSVFYEPEQQRAGHPEYELEVALREGRYGEEGWRVRKDGSRFWANVLITAVFDGDGRHVGFAKVTRDHSAQREAEEKLRQSEEKFRLLVEAVHDYAIFMLDPDGRVASWNAGAERSQGYRAGEIIGRHFRVFYPPEQQASRHPEHELEVALREGRYEEEGWRVRPDGTRFWANVVITAVFNDQGTHVGFAKVTRDTTERRLGDDEREAARAALASANASLEALNARLRQASEDQSQFLAVTAHELRTPVAVLGGSADTLSSHWDDLTSDERAGLLEGMASSARRLQRLLSDLLTAARLDNNSLRLMIRPTSLLTLLTAAVRRARAAKPNAELVVEVAPDLEARADPDRLAQAVDNLIDNALRHGAPPVRVSARQVDGNAEIRISDAGEGVRPDIAPRLFERFATGDSRDGTGLGLFVARELALAQGGDAGYEPTDGERHGAFTLSIPLA